VIDEMESAIERMRQILAENAGVDGPFVLVVPTGMAKRVPCLNGIASVVECGAPISQRKRRKAAKAML
jgi:hypothetical protein